MAATFSPKQVAKMTGVSVAGVRNYADDPRYDRWFSDYARRIVDPETRKYTAEDVRLVAFIGSKTKGEGLTHEDVVAALEAGELDHFDSWEGEEDEGEETQGEGAAGSTELATAAQAGAVLAFLEEFRARETAAREEVDHLRVELRAREETYQEIVNDLRHKLGEAEGKLTAIEEARARRPAWLRWLVGG